MTIANHWCDASSIFAIGPSDVHIWRAAIDVMPPIRNGFYDSLAADERVRASRFHFDRDRNRFIAARGILRNILSLYLRQRAEAIQFDYNGAGKPRLANCIPQDRICFNLSHSRALALYAIALDREVGIDVESIRLEAAGEQIARHFFSPHEIAALDRTPSDLRTQAFFNCWTRKEAFVKAKGEGLSIALDSFDVSLFPGEPARLIRTGADPQDISRWTLRDLQPKEGYAAAVAFEGGDSRLTLWQWPENGAAPIMTPGADEPNLHGSTDLK